MERGADGDFTISSSQSIGRIINATNFTLKSGATLTTSARLVPIIIKATNSITIESGGVINVDGKGYCNNDVGNNVFGITPSSSNGNAPANVIGVSGGGTYGWTWIPNDNQGGHPVEVNAFLSYVKSNYIALLADNNQSIIPLFGGAGIFTGDLDYNYCVGGGAVILCAPTINFAGTIYARGLGGNAYSWNGGGGGGGGWIGFFSRVFNNTGSYNANGGGGGGAGWNQYGTPGETGGNGGNAGGGGYSRGGGGGGSTTLNANGGTPGNGGAGSQFAGQNGSTSGDGGGAGNASGSDRGGAGGSGGAAGKISWIQT